MNSTFIDGNLGQDVTLAYTAKGKPYCRFSLANAVYFKGNKTTEWINCIAWGKTAENFAALCKKGTHILIENGRLCGGNITTKEGRRYQMQLTVFLFTVLGRGIHKNKEEHGKEREDEGDGDY